ncbi:MAG TPA: 50S ribosomal protein L18 [Bacteroidales bacterium]|nr:50S ribosomal protein L18 [Bacteroidales bacterium]
MAQTKKESRQRIKYRIRKIVKGTAERPRMSIFRSNTNIYVQFIDDKAGHTILSVSSKELGEEKMTKTEQSKKTGLLAAKKALEKNIKTIVFDRNGYPYFGRVKALAEGAREGGLKF